MAIAEDADLAGLGDVGAAAELARDRDAVDLDHPHPVAVLLAEQRHRAEALGLVAGRHDGVNAVVVGDPAVDPVLDAVDVLGRQRLAVGEVEAQLVGPHGRAGLAHVRAEPLAQRRVQQVRGGVVRGGR